MKQKTITRKRIEFICKIFTVLLFLLCIPVSMFFFNAGRKILLGFTIQFLHMKNIELEINDIEDNFSKANEILVKFPDKSKLIIEKISFDKEKFFNRIDINIDKLTFYASNQGKTGSINDNVNIDISRIISCAKNLRKYVHKIELKKGFISGLGKNYKINLLRYRSDEKKDTLLCELNDGMHIESIIKWKGLHGLKGRINFTKIFGFDGNVEIQNTKSNETFYKINAKNESVAVKLDGKFENFMELISINDIFIEYRNKIYRLFGELHLNDKKLLLSSEINLDVWAEKIPKQIGTNFKNVSAIVHLNYFLDEHKKSYVDVIFEKNNSSKGNLRGILQNNNFDLVGDLSWINICGYQLEKINCRITNFKRASLNLSGKDFSLSLNANRTDDKVIIENAVFNAEGFGKIVAAKPFIADSNPDICGEFEFSQLAFFNKILPVSGDIRGTFAFQNNRINVDCSGNKLHFDTVDIINYDFLMDDNNKVIHAEAKNISELNVKWHDVICDIQQENLKLTGRLNNDSLLSIYGKISNKLKTISIDKGIIDSHDMKCDFKKCNLNFAADKHEIICEVLNKKSQQSGTINFLSDKDSKELKFNSFQPAIFTKIFDCWIPKCKLNGTITAVKSNNIFTGKGHVALSGLLPGRNSIEVNGKLNPDGIKADVFIRNSKNELSGKISMPLVINGDGKITKNFASLPLQCYFSGTANLEHLFELPDRSDARGILNCDLKISGNFDSPQINGTLSLKKAYFVIGDIYLRNGDIEFRCAGNNISVAHAKFIDTKKHELKATGNGKFFFDNFIPNIKTNLDLLANNFTLFDSDDLKIIVSGPGKITGSIDDLLISGNVDVVKCEMQRRESAAKDQKDGIIIENEINIDNKRTNKEENEKDFCRYDIVMRCPNVIIEGDVFNIKLSGDLHLISNCDRQASLVGKLNLKGGKVELFGKRLVMTKGSADFFEDYPFNPKVNILCENHVGDMIVYLKIKNSPKKGGSFDLYSSPNYPQEVILSQMLFGKELKYLSVSEAAQFAQVMSNFHQTGYIFSIMNTFKSTGIIDNISFSNSNNQGQSLNTNSQTSATQGSMNVSAGKYIGDNLFISVNKNSNDTTSFDIDYSITPTISVKANTNGEAGISWKYKY